INTIIYYGSLVFLEHVPHQTASTALWANVIIGAINFAATIVGMLLIDRAGRKPLLMSAFAGMALSLIAVSAAIRFEASGIVVRSGLNCRVLLCMAQGPGNEGAQLGGNRALVADSKELIRAEAADLGNSFVNVLRETRKQIPEILSHRFA